jgi:hypothetical protein
LAKISLTIETQENLYEAIINSGIDNAVHHLLKKEKTPRHYLAFRMGVTIVCKTSLLGLLIKSLFAVSVIHVRKEKEIPNFSRILLFGANDNFRPDA